MKIWEEEINAKGGLLGRPVKLVYYDDQSNPATVPGIYTKLLDVDKVDIVASDYGTNLIAPAMPIVIQKRRMFFVAVRPRRQQRVSIPEILLDACRPAAPTRRRLLEGFLRARDGAEPEAADASRSSPPTPNSRATPPTAPARTPRTPGCKIVYDKTYPPNTTDFTPIVRAIDATNPDLVLSFSYPPDSVGMVRAANEIGLKTKMFGGGLVGLQYAVDQAAARRRS